MSSSAIIQTRLAVPLVLIATVLASYALWVDHSPHKRRQRLRQKLPPSLITWRVSGGGHKDDEQIWETFDQVLRDEGYLQWSHDLYQVLRSPDLTYPLSSGFGYAIPSRPEPNGIGNVGSLRRYDYMNPLTRAVRTRDGHDVIMRVIVIKSEGHDHLKILKRLAVGENSLLSNNHTLPMIAELQFEDIILGVFPKVGAGLRNAYGSWTKNSVGDIIDMVMQMLEALAFIHNLKIAHRDAFHDNFLVQWHPESMLTMKISPSRPRVYLTDFEVAVDFPPEIPAEECLVTGYPLGGSFTNLAKYKRAHAPEFASGHPYSPFKLDVWQLATSLSRFKSTIAPIDEVLIAMTDIDPTRRLTAQEALDRLQTVVYSITPESLLIAPLVTGR